MSNNRLFFEGLDELRQALRDLPEHLAEQARAIIEESTNGAYGEIFAGYDRHRRAHRPTKINGQEVKPLADQTRKKVSRDGLTVIGEVRNSSPLANIFENGTQARHTDLGVDRGVMPAAHVFVPVITRRRRAMYEALKALVAGQGLEVSGDA